MAAPKCPERTEKSLDTWDKGDLCRVVRRDEDARRPVLGQPKKLHMLLACLAGMLREAGVKHLLLELRLELDHELSASPLAG